MDGMELVTPELSKRIFDKIEDPDYPDVDEWGSEPKEVFISDEGVFFTARGREDAERTLYAFARIIGSV